MGCGFAKGMGHIYCFWLKYLSSEEEPFLACKKQNDVRPIIMRITEEGAFKASDGGNDPQDYVYILFYNKFYKTDHHQQTNLLTATRYKAVGCF